MKTAFKRRFLASGEADMRLLLADKGLGSGNTTTTPIQLLLGVSSPAKVAGNVPFIIVDTVKLHFGIVLMRYPRREHSDAPSAIVSVVFMFWVIATIVGLIVRSVEFCSGFAVYIFKSASVFVERALSTTAVGVSSSKITRSSQIGVATFTVNNPLSTSVFSVFGPFSDYSATEWLTSKVDKVLSSTRHVIIPPLYIITMPNINQCEK